MPKVRGARNDWRAGASTPLFHARTAPDSRLRSECVREARGCARMHGSSGSKAKRCGAEVPACGEPHNRITNEALRGTRRDEVAHVDDRSRMVWHTTRPATHRPIRQQGNARSGDAQARRAGTCAAVGEGRSAEARGPPHQYISNGASERLLRGGVGRF